MLLNSSIGWLQSPNSHEVSMLPSKEHGSEAVAGGQKTTDLFCNSGLIHWSNSELKLECGLGCLCHLFVRGWVCVIHPPWPRTPKRNLSTFLPHFFRMTILEIISHCCGPWALSYPSFSLTWRGPKWRAPSLSETCESQFQHTALPTGLPEENTARGFGIGQVKEDLIQGKSNLLSGLSILQDHHPLAFKRCANNAGGDSCGRRKLFSMAHLRPLHLNSMALDYIFVHLSIFLVNLLRWKRHRTEEIIHAVTR
jgi:hypothetical protein